MEKEVVVNMQQPGEHVLVLREGTANNEPRLKKVLIVGHIDSVKRFIEKVFADRSDTVVNSHILVDHASAQILLHVENNSDDIGAKVTGQLVKNKALLEFKINSEESFTSKQLIGLLRKNASCFDNLETIKKFIKDLQNFEVKFEQISSEADDRQGTKERKFKEEVKFTKGQLPTNLRIVTPVYDGTDPVEFDLEIELDRQGNQAVYSFYSLGYEDKVKKITDIILQANVSAKCEALFPIIHSY